MTRNRREDVDIMRARERERRLDDMVILITMLYLIERNEQNNRLRREIERKKKKERKKVDCMNDKNESMNNSSVKIDQRKG